MGSQASKGRARRRCISPSTCSCLKLKAVPVGLSRSSCFIITTPAGSSQENPSRSLSSFQQWTTQPTVRRSRMNDRHKIYSSRGTTGNNPGRTCCAAPTAIALLRRSQRRALPFRFASGPVVRYEVELRQHQDEDSTWRFGPLAGPGKFERSSQRLRAGPCRRRRCHLQWTDRGPRQCRWLTAGAGDHRGWFRSC